MINMELPKAIWQQKEAIAYVTDKKLVSKALITYLPGIRDSVFGELFKLDGILLPISTMGTTRNTEKKKLQLASLIQIG